MPPATIPANAPGLHTRALLGFAALITQHDPKFANCPPALRDNGRIVHLGDWAIALDETGPPSRQFGRHANCNAQARCLNCMPHCATEKPAVDLSARAGGCSALWVEARGLNGDHPEISVRSHVPDKPGQSDLWVPTLCPVTGRLQLFAVNGDRKALLQVNGQLSIKTALPCPHHLPFSAMVFGRVWKSLIAAGPVPWAAGANRGAAVVAEAL